MDEDKPSQRRTEELIDRLNFLESVIRDQTARLYAIEQYLGIARQPAATQTPLPAPPDARQTSPRPSKSTNEAQPWEGVNASPVPPHAPTPGGTNQPPAPGANRGREAAPTRGRGELEARIGGNWFNWIGIIAISFGVAFFLKYAFENEWIGPGGRVSIGVILGVGFLAAAESLRSRGYPKYAFGLSGGGILILYLSVYAAFAFYELIGNLLAFFFMAVVTMAAALLAARYNALPIAVLGLIGGFLTPILLSTGVDNQAGLFGYMALLDAGVLALAYSRQWRSLNYMAFAATILMTLAWMLEWYAPEKLWPTIFFLTLFFAIFALLAVLYNVVNRRRTGWLDLLLVFFNAIFYFAVSYELLDDRYEGYLGLFALLMAAFYVGLGYFTYRRDSEDHLLVMTFLGLALLFLVLAVPIQLDQQWVTMGWAVEGAVLTWIGLRAGDRPSRYAALLVFIIAASHWLLTDVTGFAFQANSAFIPLLNRRAYSCAVLIASLVAAAWFYRRFESNADEQERTMMGGLYVLGANMMAVTLLSLDANDYFEKAMARSQGAASGSFDSARHFTLSGLWGLYGCVLLVVGIIRGFKLLRMAALALLAIATLKALLVDLQFYDATWHSIIFNETFATFALLIAALAIGAWLYARASNVDERERSTALTTIIIVANLLAIVALSAEASGYYERSIAARDAASVEFRDLRLAQQLSLSVIWTVYGGAMLAVGIARRLSLLRIMALLLLGVTILKVFFFDLASLDRFYRIIAFIVLGAILLAVSFLYQKYRQRWMDGKEMSDAPSRAV